MARENEMREFTRSLFRGRPDLSTLTQSIVRRKFLAHVGRDHLEPEEKQALKRLVEEELLKMQMDEAGSTEEELYLTKKVKRSLAPLSDRGRKRSRFNSESESSSAASSPDSFGPPAKNGMAAKVSPAKESPKHASNKAVESSDEEQPGHLAAKMGLRESREEEEEEGSVRTSKVWKEESSEEEKEERDKKSKGRTRKKPGTKNKKAPGKISASKQQARKDSESTEEEPVQKTARKAEGKRGAASRQESEKESDSGEDIPAEKKENREEEEDWKPTARSRGGERSAWEGRLTRDQDSGDSSEEEEPLVQRKSKDRDQRQGVEKQSGSSEDGEDSCKVQPTAPQGRTKVAKSGSISGDQSDVEREVSDSEARGSSQGAKKNRSSKNSKKGRIQSPSSSSDGSPEPKGRKTASGRRGEDHPAVMRLKRYIRACGAHRNYKKLLSSCRSHKERLSVLRSELEALGMKGNPSLEKCRALKEQREEAAEVASLDVANIINSSGRPRRRTAWNPSAEAAPQGELYCRTLDSEEERPRQAPPDWSHMRGIISSDGESN